MALQDLRPDRLNVAHVNAALHLRRVSLCKTDKDLTTLKATTFSVQAFLIVFFLEYSISHKAAKAERRRIRAENWKSEVGEEVEEERKEVGRV